ncbi:MAG: MBL fold metallo-hydrolase [Lachnotalea sp.]
MKLTLLGTGNALVTECFNTCFALSCGRQHFLVDTGGGNRILKVLKDSDIAIEDIHDIFITHEHIDHMLGIIWLIRVIGTKMDQGTYEGKLFIYCHRDLVDTIQTIANLTLTSKICKNMGESIIFVPLETGDCKEILGCEVTFFDIFSSKAKQYGFTMNLSSGKKFACLGDEPYNEEDYEYVKGSDWLMHEAFCLYKEADKFKPYEKHHSTVKDACQVAEKLEIPNLILYHTEEVNLKKRKELYREEGLKYYNGNLYVPYDLEIFEV